MVRKKHQNPLWSHCSGRCLHLVIMTKSVQHLICFRNWTPAISMKYDIYIVTYMPEAFTVHLSKTILYLPMSPKYKWLTYLLLLKSKQSSFSRSKERKIKRTMKLAISMLIMAAFCAGAPSSPLARTLRTEHAEDTLSRSKFKITLSQGFNTWLTRSALKDSKRRLRSCTRT